MINWMKKEDINWIPPVRDNDHGWLNVNGEIMLITNWHHFDDFGQTVETVTVKCDETGAESEYYSMNEGETWHTELD